MLPMIVGFAGTDLTPDEYEFFQETQPCGYILFQRNIDSPGQLRRLTDRLRVVSGRDDVPILIDQEGGRVQKLRPPHWVDLPVMRDIGTLFARDSLKGLLAVETLARIIAGQLRECGINTVCAPVVDVPAPGAHDVIGDRAFSTDVDHVVPLAATFARHLSRHGITPVIKHIPGHGRADADSHYACPVVTTGLATLAATDFKAFREVAAQAGPTRIWAMTAHVVFTAIDDVPASVSAKTLGLVRDTLHVTGPIIADTIEMQALGGTLAERARATLAAGCDAFLLCSGKLAETRDVAAAIPAMTPAATQRFAAAAPTLSGDAPDWRAETDVLRRLMGVEAFPAFRSAADITEALHR